jgi:HSP20 family molecular chaperone IbpA
MVDRDAITANLRDGFLVISLPFRKKQEPVSRNIPINTTTTSTS